MDPNNSFNQSLNGSFDLSNASLLNLSTASQVGGFPAQPIPTSPPVNYQNLSRDDLIRLQHINQQQIQQLATQMSHMQVSAQSPVLSPVSPPVFPVGPTFIPGVMDSPTAARHIFPAQPQAAITTSHIDGLVPTGDLQFSPNGNVPNMITTNMNSPVYNSPAYPNNSMGINGQLPNQATSASQVNTGHLNLAERNIATPNTLPLAHTNAPQVHPGQQYQHITSSTPQHSPGPATFTTDTTDGPSYMSRPRQQVSSRPPSLSTAFTPQSDRSSLSSTTSSPLSAGPGPLSPDSSWSEASGSKSPDVTFKSKTDSDLRSPIQNNPLQIKTRYPQDKCYSCMKKVYKMESIGPVKGVVYHKGCFRCKSCNTQLTMKNFNSSQSDSYDLAVYCKSHQPTNSGKTPQLDSESFEIKSALNAPKKSGVLPESERVPVHNYSMDVNAREIQHARKAPVQNLQGGNKLRNNAWSKSKREHAVMPPPDVVRHDDPVPEMDPDSYNKFQVENTPDY